MRLYHASLSPDIATRLEPRTPRTMPDGQVKHFLFATTNRLAACGYAFKTPSMLAHLFGEDFSFFIVGDRRYFDDNPAGMIYEVPADQFRYFGSDDNRTTEWVTDAAVEIDTSRAERISLEQAMMQGVQFFALADGYTRKQVMEQLELPNIYNLVTAKVLIHENAVRGINPDLSPSAPGNPAASAVPRPS